VPDWACPSIESFWLTVNNYMRQDTRHSIRPPSDAAKLSLSDEQSGADPALALIATVPSFDVTTYRFDDGERRFNQVGAGQLDDQDDTIARDLFGCRIAESCPASKASRASWR
jgi:hypothetical protein